MKSDIMKVIAIALIGAIIVAVVYVNTPRGPRGGNDGPKTDGRNEVEMPQDDLTGNAKTNILNAAVESQVLPMAIKDNQQSPGGISEQGIDEGRFRRFNEERLSRKGRKHGKERRRVTERAAANLPKEGRVRVFENSFAVTGGCEWSKLAHKNECTFLFDAVLIAKSEIEDAKILPGGELRIEEKRTIDKAREKIIITDASLKIDLKSSPIDQIEEMAKGVAKVSASISAVLVRIPIPAAQGGAVLAGNIAAGAGAVCVGIEIARQFDGQDLAPLIGKENLKCLYQCFVDKKVKSIKTLVRAMEGKSYRVIYTQEPAPSKKYMQVAWEHFDGTPLTAEEDFIISKANIFIDADMLPDSGAEPPVGQEWEVSAEEVASMFCYDDKLTCAGGVKVSRKPNLQNGDWYIEVARNQKVAVRNAEGRTSGSVLVKEGDATLASYSPHQTKTLQLVSSGNIMEFTPQTLLWFLNYDTKRGADCQFKGVMRTYMEE